jgi:hypothetical protein
MFGDDTNGLANDAEHKDVAKDTYVLAACSRAEHVANA